MKNKKEEMLNTAIRKKQLVELIPEQRKTLSENILKTQEEQSKLRGKNYSTKEKSSR